MNNLSKSLKTGLMLLAILIFFSGCGYPEVSQSTYAYAKAIYTVANQKDADRIPVVHQQIENARDNGEILANEAEFLFEILDDASAGNWSDASRQARKLMMDQVSG